jgi:hypothetical protein
MELFPPENIPEQVLTYTPQLPVSGPAMTLAPPVISSIGGAMGRVDVADTLSTPALVGPSEVSTKLTSANALTEPEVAPKGLAPVLSRMLSLIDTPKAPAAVDGMTTDAVLLAMARARFRVPLASVSMTEHAFGPESFFPVLIPRVTLQSVLVITVAFAADSSKKAMTVRYRTTPPGHQKRFSPSGARIVLLPFDRIKLVTVIRSPLYEIDPTDVNQ